MTEQDKQRCLDALQSAYNMIDSTDHKTKAMLETHNLMNQADRAENASVYMESIARRLDQAIKAEAEQKESLVELNKAIAYVKATPAEELAIDVVESLLK